MCLCSWLRKPTLTHPTTSFRPRCKAERVPNQARKGTRPKPTATNTELDMLSQGSIAVQRSCVLAQASPWDPSSSWSLKPVPARQLSLQQGAMAHVLLTLSQLNFSLECCSSKHVPWPFAFVCTIFKMLNELYI